jgi:hypothetical protein
MVLEADDGAVVGRKDLYYLEESIHPVALQQFPMSVRAVQRDGSFLVVATKSYDRSNRMTDVPLWTVRM